VEFDGRAAVLAANGIAVPVALFQCVMHGGILTGEDTANAAETIFDDPPAMMVAPHREAGRFGTDCAMARTMLSGMKAHEGSFIEGGTGTLAKSAQG